MRFLMSGMTIIGEQARDTPFQAVREGTAVCARSIRALLGLALFATLGGLWIVLPRILCRPFPYLAFSALLWGFGIRVSRDGHLPISGELLVANHVSWTDIPVLGVAIGAAFVAKREVRQWPGIGRLAERYGCLFVARDRRASVRTQADALTKLLETRNIILFPEGTTGNGLALLPFRSSLIESVAGGRGGVIPVTITYQWANGENFDAESWDRFAWVGDSGLLSHAIQLAFSPSIEARVMIGDPLESRCRKALAQQAHEAIAARLVVRPAEDQAAALNFAR